MNDHYYELRLRGLEPQRFRTLQAAMAKAVLAVGVPGGIWQVIEEGDEPVEVIRYYEGGGLDAVAPPD